MTNAHFSTGHIEHGTYIRVWRGELFIKMDQFSSFQPPQSADERGVGELLIGNEATRRNSNLPVVEATRAGVEEIPSDEYPLLQDPLQNIPEQVSMNGPTAFKITDVQVHRDAFIYREEMDWRAHHKMDQGKRMPRERNAKLTYCSKVIQTLKSNNKGGVA